MVKLGNFLPAKNRSNPTKWWAWRVLAKTLYCVQYKMMHDLIHFAPSSGNIVLQLPQYVNHSILLCIWYSPALTCSILLKVMVHLTVNKTIVLNGWDICILAPPTPPSGTCICSLNNRHFMHYLMMHLGWSQYMGPSPQLCSNVQLSWSYACILHIDPQLKCIVGYT